MGEWRADRHDRGLSDWRLDAASSRRYHDDHRGVPAARSARSRVADTGGLGFRPLVSEADELRLCRLEGPASGDKGGQRLQPRLADQGDASAMVTFGTESLVIVAPNMNISPPSVPCARYDAVVVGAGPYGLSTAAHLRGRGLTVAVFGKPLELWRRHMPKGMLLRSHWWATSLSAPGEQYGFERFLRASKYETRYPVPIEAFIDYALWFQHHAVPDVDETYVASVQRQRDSFLLTLEDGRTVQSAAVVMAVGLYYYAARAEPYGRLPGRLGSPSPGHHDFGALQGKRVLLGRCGPNAVGDTAPPDAAGAGGPCAPPRANLTD